MLSTDIKLRTPATDSAVAATNGGRMTGTAITSGVVGNTWPAVTPAERTAGSILWRKRFVHVADDADGTLLDARVWLDVETPGDDWCTMCAGTAIDFEDDLAGTEDHYGAAPVTTGITAGGSTVIVTVPDAELLSGGAYPIFRVGDMVRLTKQATPSTTSTTAEWLTIAAGGISESGNEITITVEETIANDYALVDSPRLCSVLELGDIETSWSAVSNSGGAAYDTATYAPILDNIGTFTQRLTCTFTDATTFTVAGDGVGALASGTVGADYSPTNSEVSKPWLALSSGGWSGLTITAGATFVLDIVGAQKAIWRRRKVPAGADYIASNYTVLGVYGAAT